MYRKRMSFDTLKTEFIVVVSNARFKEIEETLCIYVEGEAIYVKSLGFYVAQQFDWKNHVTHVLIKCSSAHAVLHNAKGSLPKEAILAFYLSVADRKSSPLWHYSLG